MDVVVQHRTRYSQLTSSVQHIKNNQGSSRAEIKSSLNIVMDMIGQKLTTDLTYTSQGV